MTLSGVFLWSGALQSEVIPTRCYHLVELGSESMEVVPVWHQI